MTDKKDYVKQFLRKHLSEEEAESLSASIVEDATTRHSEVAGFASDAETYSEGEIKSFGEGHATVQNDKLMKWKVLTTETITYPNNKGEVEAYAFDGSTIQSLADKLEGVPLVIATADTDEPHNAELPFGYFTNKYEIMDEVAENGKPIKALYQWAKLRSDRDSPIDFDALVQNPQLTVNGGEKNLYGSLRFKSRDIPFFYEDGSKVNYMTSPVPIHYAGVDVPVVKGAGLVEKTFGNKEKKTGDTMTDEKQSEVKAEAKAEDASVDIESRLKEALGELDMAALIKGTAVDEIVKNVIAGLGTPDTVARADYETLEAELNTLKQEKEEAELTGLRDKIVTKALGADADEATVEAFVEEEGLKDFGKSELNGYLAALTKAATRASEGDAKNFGKGKVDMTNADKKRKFPQIKL